MNQHVQQFSSAGAPPARYWEDRARRFAGVGAGLAAVCSYGMPRFYNRAIELAQRRALDPWLRVAPGTRVLDVGCGVGRWSRRLAARGARVLGVDLAPTMVAEARRRAAADGVAERCEFQVADLGTLDLGRRFPLIVGVTVLQHVLQPARLAEAVSRLAAHLAPDGRLVLLEAAPSRPAEHCDSAIFRARTVDEYRRLFAEQKLRIEAVSGVDPARLRDRFLPFYPRLPRPLALLGLSLVTAGSLPVDLAFGRRWVERSWHKVFVLGKCPPQRSADAVPG